MKKRLTRNDKWAALILAVTAAVLILTTCDDFALKQTISDMVERKVVLLGPDDDVQIAQKTPELTWSSIGDDRYWRVRAVGTDGTEGPWSEVRSFEIVPSELPKLVNTLDLGAHAWGLEVSGDFLYSSAGSNGIKVFDINSPAEPELVDTYYVYLLDISDPANVVVKDSYGTVGKQLYGLLYMGVSLYVGHSEGYYRFDSSPPDLGSPTADIDPSGSANRVNCFDQYGSYLVYTVDDEGIRILNANGNTEVGSAAAADTAKFDNSMVTVYEHYAYVTSMNSDYIEIFDIEDVTNPVSAATTLRLPITLPSCQFLTAVSGFLILPTRCH